MLIWHTNVNLHGSFFLLGSEILNDGLFKILASVWLPVFFGTARAWAMIAVFVILELLLMRFLPGRPFRGPVTPMGNVPEYRANGVPAYLVTILVFVTASFVLKLFPATIIYDRFDELLGALNFASLAFCLVLYLKGRYAPSSTDSGLSGNFIFDYYWGTELYPGIFGWDVKMFTNCRFGLMGWPLLIISFAAKQNELYGISDSMIVAVALQIIYVTKFFIWEPGYMSSMDIMHDRAGFYICWGCLVWVPSVYTSHTLYLVDHPNRLGLPLASVIFILGAASIAVNYLADRQRQKVRATGGNCTVWGKKPVLIKALYKTESGEEKQSLLLASGWWGLSRHFHYIPEILAAFFWSVPALFLNFMPYFYVTFLTILLTHRSIRDDRRCAVKYGAYWDEYRKLVPYKIIPKIW
ncbi:MAG: ERG4/ERG24 family protein [Spirochaetes bacterium]|jgi:7-dehydrocholesterol reductase|nr:ERG4/ERG24 family protein [Spirochaetota bacterium]